MDMIRRREDLKRTKVHPFQTLNSPLQYIDTINGIELWIKREDMIHPDISGNKWRKLKYYLQDFERSGKTSILTFGGAFSNHIAAVAALGKMTGIPVKALVRGEEVVSNPTLDFCRKHDMEMETISRKKYDTKDSPEFLNAMEELLPDVYVIPEGGKGVLGIRGCTEILSEVHGNFDYICCSAGTGTTFAGLMLSGYETEFVMYPALKGASFLKQGVLNYIADFQSEFSTSSIGKISPESRFILEEDYHFGGYGKTDKELIHFINTFHREYNILLDPVYTAKMMFGILDGIKKGQFKKRNKVLAIHTGGLQGIKGMNERLRKKGMEIIDPDK